jgi:hypothetical protein
MRLILLALLLAACQRPPRPPMLEPSALRIATATLASAVEAPGVRIIYGPTSCQWAGPNPVVLPTAMPRVGRELVVRWQLSCVPPPPTVVDPDGVTSPPIVTLLGSTRPLSEPMPAGPAAPGCWLLVYPDFLIPPAPESWLTYDRERGLVTMRWTPIAGHAGADLYSQLLVAIPGVNSLGIISSAGLHLHIGSAQP